MSKNYLDARKMLLKACNSYIQHNQAEVDKLRPKGFYNPAYTFFDYVLGKYDPDPGFNDWVLCQYYYLLKCILVSFDMMDDPHTYFRYFKYPFEELKWWKEEEFDQTAPETVFHNLNALLNVLDYHIKRMLPRLAP